jgi:hypothetical protein
MPYFPEIQREWRAAAPNYGTQAFTKPRYPKNIFIESEHLAPLFASKRKKNCDTTYCPAGP